MASLGVSLVQQHGGFVPRESLAKSSELGNLATNVAVIHLTTFELSANKKKKDSTLGRNPQVPALG